MTVCFRFALALLFLPLGIGSASAAPVPGDVDQDGRLTTRDALMIFQFATAPEMARLHTIRAACDFNNDGACATDDAYAILVTVITDYNDIDADGVANADDCNPFDERIATEHTYFLDYDRDSFGSGDNTVQACLLAPPVPSVAWRGDPDDATPFSVESVVPKGARVLGLDFLTGAEDGTFRDDLRRELGVDAMSLRVAWRDIEASANTFSGPSVAVLNALNAELPQRGLKLSLTLNPVTSTSLVVPSDLKSAIESGALRLSDPAVIARFNALLTFVHDRLNGVDLATLQIGYEVDKFLALTPQYFWADYGTFFAAVSAHAKTLWGPTLKVGITASHTALVNEPSRSLLRSLNALSDQVSLTYFGRRSDGRVVEPTAVRGDIEQVIALYYPKPISFDAVGYPSSPMLGSSITKQSQFVRAFFETWDHYAPVMPFAAFSRLHDYWLPLAHYEALGSGGNVQIETAFQQSIGLRTWDGSGAHKPAYQTLRDLMFARGWWKIPPATQRSFDLGFTPALYDFPPTALEYGAMLDWLQHTIQTDADRVNIHLDHGVPWVEALGDTFQSPELPYSASVKAMWASLKERVPAGKQLMVSINPLGVPRNVIAPYFGVGEGFTYDANFVRVGDGAVADAENRLPPGDWNTYPLNHPNVKLAYLNYAKRIVQYFVPERLIIAIEITATMNDSPAAYEQLMDLLSYVYSHLKADPATASLPLGVSISATTFMTDEYGVSFKYEDQPPLKRELQVQGLAEVLPVIDFIGLSLYPHYGKYNASTMPASMFDSLMPLLASTGKPIVVSETGWPGESYTVLGVPFFSDAEKQDRYYKLLFYEIEKSASDFKLVISFAPRDSDLGWQRLLAGSQQTPPTVSPQFVEFYKYFRDIGIYDGDGLPRQVTTTWRERLALPYVPKQ
jgi:hypothetical protein